MVHLEKVTSQNVWALLKLAVDDTQKEFVATNTESIVEAYLSLACGGHALPYGIYDDETPVGFLMIGYGVDDTCEDPPAIAFGSYCLWRLMIDRRYQGKGYGRRALECALEIIQSKPCGESEFCYLSYEPENTAARELYHSLGFRENGEYDGEEIVAVLKLS